MEFFGGSHDALGPKLGDDFVHEARHVGPHDDRLVPEPPAHHDLHRLQHGHVLHHDVERLVTALSEGKYVMRAEPYLTNVARTQGQ